MSDSISIKVDGLKELRDRFKEIDSEGRKRVQRAVNANAIEYHRKVRNSISKPSGRHVLYYYWGKGHEGRKRGIRRGIKHWSSKPGMPPNSNTGTLRGKITITKARGIGTVAFVKSGAKYSRALEMAKDRGKRRPFMGPMYKKLRPLFVSRIKQAMMGAL